MSRTGRLICIRLASRIGLVVGIFFGIILLVEFLDTGRFNQTAELAGPLTSTGLAFLSALRWSLLGLPVTVLIGAILGLIDLQSHREMVIMSAGGRSIWSLLRWPILMVLTAGVITTTVVDSFAIRVYQGFDAAQIGWGRAYGVQNRETWFSQSGSDGDYMLYARTVLQQGSELEDITILRPQPEGGTGTRIHARSAVLEPGRWVISDGMVIDVDQSPRPFAQMAIATRATPSELSLQLGTAEDMSWFDLRRALRNGITDPFAQAAAETRFQKLNAMPFVLVGSLLIAFAFTAGYRRAGHYGWTIVQGIVLGLVVFVVTEMADRAGSAGVIDPIAAAWGPALLAIIIGLTVILRREDGRV
ncbi:LptF/LptG family permease [Pelagibacterium luteolum]|uniref:Lipopolysaccharide export system permease protein n=1 Tax=Pelagibacterium luteolum TaxID=440168 RepID=A0A1G7VV28_9HYPH|nr:LptF/LptG family permease [Pelagibacterium luteolum]SDG63695.1 lipopolysaccharide export system permease protein [Pelagibacterium luteolum]